MQDCGIADAVGLDLPVHFVKEIELKFRQDLHGIRDATVLHMLHSGPNDVPGVLGQRPVAGGIDDHGVAGHGQCGDLAEGIDHRRIRIGDKDHVALLHHGISVVGGIKTDAAFHGVLRKVFGGNGDMAVLAVDVHHFKIHHPNSLFFDQVKNILNALCHM